MKLVVVGGAPYADEYIQEVMRSADPRVVFPGYVFGRGYWELQRHAYLFCAPTEVGGTHPVILEAMAAGNCVLVNDHAPNQETVGDAGPVLLRREGTRRPDRAARPPRRRPRPRRLLPRARARARPGLLVGGGHRPVRGAAALRARGHGARRAARRVRGWDGRCRGTGRPASDLPDADVPPPAAAASV